MNEQEILESFRKLPIRRQIEIGKWAGMIAQLTTREAWRAMYAQVPADILALVKYFAVKAWLDAKELKKKGEKTDGFL